MNKAIKRVLAIALLVAAIAAGSWYWQRAAKIRSTDNAYVNADVVQIASPLNGPVSAVYVREGQLVQAGQALFDIDPEPHEVALAQAKAKLAQAEQGDRQDQTDVSASDATVRQAQAELANANAAARRTHSLVLQNFLSRQAEDDTQARVRVAEASVAQAHAKLACAKAHVARVGDATPAVLAARAAVAQAALDLKHTHVVASKAGWIVNLTLVVSHASVEGYSR